MVKILVSVETCFYIVMLMLLFMFLNLVEKIEIHLSTALLTIATNGS